MKNSSPHDQQPTKPADKPLTVLDIDRLRIGDVIGTGGATLKSGLIRSVTGGGPLSHVALYIGDGVAVEAVIPGVRQVWLHTYIFTTSPQSVRVLRPRRKVVDFRKETERAEALRSEAIFYTNNPYSLSKMLGVVWPFARRLARRDEVICSELVAKAYGRAGVEIGPGLEQGKISPNTIFNSKIFQDVTRQCLRHVEASEIIIFDNRFSNFGSALVSLLFRVLPPVRHAHDTPMERWTVVDFLAYLCWHELLDRCAKLKGLTRHFWPVGLYTQFIRKVAAVDQYQQMLRLAISREEYNIRRGESSIATKDPLRPWQQKLLRQQELRRLKAVQLKLSYLYDIRDRLQK